MGMAVITQNDSQHAIRAAVARLTPQTAGTRDVKTVDEQPSHHRTITSIVICQRIISSLSACIFLSFFVGLSLYLLSPSYLFLFLFPSCVFGNFKKSRWITASRNPYSLLILLCLLSTTTCRLYGAYTRSNIITSWCSYQGFAFGKKCCMCGCACMCGEIWCTLKLNPNI